MAKIRVKAPFIGLNLNTQAGDLSPAEAQVAQNVSLHSGTIRSRPGWTAMNVTFENPLGIYDYLKANESVSGGIEVFQIFKDGSHLYVFDGVTFTELGSSLALSTEELASFVTVNNRVYIADGVKFLVTDGSSVYDAQVDRPVGGGDPVAHGTGNLTGTYDYKFTWYSSTWGQETPSSDPTAEVVCVSSHVDIGFISPIPHDRADGRFDLKKIYRRKVSANETTWSYVASIAHNAETYTDDISDSNVDILTTAPLSYASENPLVRYLAWQDDVLFAAGEDAYPTRLYYSRVGQPFAIDDYLEIGSAHDTDKITGLIAFQGLMYVFKARSIWALSGNSADTFSCKKIVPGIGCVSHHSIVAVGDLVYFLSDDGFYAFDGSQSVRLGGALDPVGPALSARRRSRDRFVIGAWDQSCGCVVWAYSPDGGTSNTRCLVYFIDNSKRVGQASWAQWSFTYSVQCLSIITNAISGARRLCIGFGNYGPNATIGLLDATDDNGVAIFPQWLTVPITMGEPTMLKTCSILEVFGSRAATESVIKISYNIQPLSSVWIELGLWHQDSDDTFVRNLARTSRRIAFGFDGQSASNAMSIEGFSLEAELSGGDVS